MEKKFKKHDVFEFEIHPLPEADIMTAVSITFCSYTILNMLKLVQYYCFFFL